MRSAAREDLILAEMESAETLAAEVKREEQAFKLADEAARTRGREMDEEEKKVQAESARLAAERDEIAKLIPQHLLDLFNRVARVRGIAVSEAKDGMCSQCHLKLRPQIYVDLKRSDELFQCVAVQPHPLLRGSRRRSSSPSRCDARERGPLRHPHRRRQPRQPGRGQLRRLRRGTGRPRSPSSTATWDAPPTTSRSTRRSSTRCATRSRRAPPTSRVFSDSELVVKQIGGRVQGEAPGHACRSIARPAR